MLEARCCDCGYFTEVRHRVYVAHMNRNGDLTCPASLMPPLVDGPEDIRETAAKEAGGDVSECR